MKEQEILQMSEKKSLVDFQRSTPVESSRTKLSRRAFIKAAITGGVGLGGAGYAGLKFLERLGWEPPEVSFEQELQTVSKTATATPFLPQEATSRPIFNQPTERTVEPFPTPEVINYWIFARADFSDSSHQIDMMITLNDSTELLIPPFTPISWREGILESGDFSPDKNTGLTYLDEDMRKILNLHSGRAGPLRPGYTMWEVQMAIETNSLGNRISPAQAEEKLKTQFMGASVLVRQREAAFAKIAAAVRVPPSLVYESTRHVYEETDANGNVIREGIVPWLAENFPDSGFSDLVDKSDVLIIKFCGRILSGEREEKRISSSFQQARFFLALKEK